MSQETTPKHVFTGVFIPVKIWLHPDFTPVEKMLLAEIKALSEDGGWCFAGNAHFAKWLKCTPQNISIYISSFKKQGFIEVKFSDEKTHSGRKMRVNLAWYHSIQNPLSPAVPPLSPAVPPLSPAVTERHFKYTSKLNVEGERDFENSTPLPNFTPLKEEEKEKNIIPAAGGGSAAADASEADGIISKWSADNLETVKMWHERSKRIFSLQEYDRLVLKFCGHYANHKEDGTQKRFLLNPLLFFRNQFPGWLADQPKFDRAQPHQAPSPQRGIEAGSLPKNLRRV